MCSHFDQAAKAIGTKALRSSGSIVANAEIAWRTQYADLAYEADPARQVEREQLGLLGRIADGLCLIEVYAHPLKPEELRSCLAKHLTYWRRRERDLENGQGDEPGAPSSAPSLWIIAFHVPAPLLAKLKLDPDPAGPNGTYKWAGDVLRVGFVVASELPRVRTTLLVRLMAAGPDSYANLAELRKLPVGSLERQIAENPLLELQDSLTKQPSLTPQEQEFLVAMKRTWEDARSDGQTEGEAIGQAKGEAIGQAKGEAIGQAKGEAIGQANAILTVLEVRGITVPLSTRDRILAQSELPTLERWLKNALVATSADSALGSA